MRNLILMLRDRGATVFFSSHVLSDAEALCSRVAILAAGHLAASGTIADIHAFQLHGWELVVADLSLALLQALKGRITRATPISDGRYSLDVPLDTPPERLLDELIKGGAHLVSLNPMRRTLEDFFVEQVSHEPNTRVVDA